MIEPIRNNIPIKLISKLLCDLDKRGMSHTQSIKLIHLYFGTHVNTFIDEPGIYHCSNFNQLSKILKYHTPSQMIRDVIQSQLFCIGKTKSNNFGLLWFASPEYLDEKSLRQQLSEPDPKQVAQVSEDAQLGGLFSAAFLHCNFAAHNLITLTGYENIILSGGLAPEVSVAKVEPEAEKTVSTIDLKIAYESFLNSMLAEPDQILQQLIKKQILQFKPRNTDEQITPDLADEIYHCLLHQVLREYFTKQDRFARLNYNAQLTWARNIIFGKYGYTYVHQAYLMARRNHKKSLHQKQIEAAQAMRQNHNHGPYEWETPEGLRYYDDPQDGLVLIPNDAQNRPTPTAVWNRGKWIVPQNQAN